MQGRPLALKELLSVIYNNRLDHHMTFGYGNHENAYRELASWKDIRVSQNTGYVPYLEHPASLG